MNEMPFPKPPPAEPLELDIWLDQQDRSEVGRESFFRGRDEEFDVFRRAVNVLHAGRVGGGTMVFQGAPGSGKSALMAECMEAVRSHSTYEDPWVAVSIKPGTLRSFERTVNFLVNAVNAESERLSEEAPDESTDRFREILGLGRKLGRELSERGDGIAGFSVGGKSDAVDGPVSNESPEWVFAEAAPLLKNFRMVVLVDEAQTIKPEIMTQGVIQCLHDPPTDIPLVAAFFGLSDTRQVLRQCGLSRFPDGRVVDLEALPFEDAACAICSVFDAYGFTGTSIDREAWVERLAELSQGWPQHINRVSVAAAQVIRENGKRILKEHLEEALERGKERKEGYYKERIDAGSSDAWVYRQLALAAKEREGGLSRHEIGKLTEFARGEKSLTVDEFVTDALHAGLLAPARDVLDFYVIPIPSLGDHLCTLDVRTPEEFRK